MALVRIDLGITQQQLADTLGISRAALSMAERGTRHYPQRGLAYLDGLREIAMRIPQAAAPPRRQRPSVASKRPLYNRIHFSSRNNKADKVHIATVRALEPVLSAGEIRAAGERLRDRLYNEGKRAATSQDGQRELLATLEQKTAITKCRLEVLELEKVAALGRATDIKANLTLITARLKAFRQIYKAYPDMRKRYRRKIAVLYVKKLRCQEQLEKFNKPAIQKRKLQIEALQLELENQLGLAEHIKKRMDGCGEGVFPE